MANVNENAVVETTETEGKVGFFKKHGKKIAIAGGALLAGLAGYGIAKLVSKKGNTESYDSDDYSSESDESVD